MLRFATRSAVLRRAATTTALTAAALLGSASAEAQQALPVGGTVTSGSATITTGANSVTVDQASNRAVVNFTSFDVAQGNRVTFNQPDATGATLARVTGNTGSTIAGQVTATGALYLVNPNGIAITTTGAVQTGGGFVASTLDITDAEFAAGQLKFSGSGASAPVINGGAITAGMGAYVALLGGSVSNGGTISVPLGKVALGSGERIALDLNGDGFMQVAMPSAAADGQLVKSGGSIVAAGGRVELRVASVAQAVRDVINVSGSINADSATGNGGSIILLGGDGGTVRTTGTLSARATGATGDGGFVETSGAKVDFVGLRTDTSSVGGSAGMWLIDPTDLTIDAEAATTIASNLANGNVTLQTDATTATGPGIQSPGNGDITVNSAISWTSANTLSLLAYNNIALTAAITGTAGGLTLTAGNDVAYAGAITASAPIDVGIFNLTNGNWSQNSATLPAFAARDFRFDVTKANFLRVTGGTGATATPYTIADVYGLQGMASVAYLGNAFALANALDASGTTNWYGGVGFNAIGTNGSGGVWNRSASIFDSIPSDGFTGSFNGRGLAITGLTINRTANYQGLFGYASGGGAISNARLVGVSIRGTGTVGGLIGVASAAITGSSASGTVSGTTNVGGLIGVASAAITGSSASGTVSGTTSVGGLIGQTASTAGIVGSSASGTVTGNGIVGGLIGSNSAPVSTSFATGNVTGGGNVGGLVGVINASTGTIDQTYATGAVTMTGSGGTIGAGGLVGFYNANSTLSRSYATGSVTGTSTSANIGGLVGTTRATITQSYATGRISGGQYRGGLVGRTVGGSVALSNFWDSYSTGINNSAGFGTAGGVRVTSDPAQASAASYAYKTSAYTGTNGLTPADWVFFDGQTRPFGAWEAVAPGGTITNSHQLQLIGRGDTAAQAGSYTLGGNIDLAETGRVVVGTPASYNGMWAGTGFVSLGTNGAGLTWNGTGYAGVTTITGDAIGYGGTFDGAGYALTNLYINRVGVITTGLFGTLSGTVRNLTVGGSVTGGSATGGMVGLMTAGQSTTLAPRLENVTSNVTVAGRQMTNGQVASASTIGGLVGSVQPRATIINARATGAVSGLNTVGGLIGYANRSTISGSASGAVSGNGYIGGLIGNQFGGTTTGYATGTVTGAIAVGGLIGVLDGTATDRGTATATQPAQAGITGPTSSDRNFGRVTANGTGSTVDNR